MATAQGYRKTLFVDTSEGCSLHNLAPLSMSFPTKIPLYDFSISSGATF